MSRPSESPAGLPEPPRQRRGRPAAPARTRGRTPAVVSDRTPGLDRFNSASTAAAEDALLGCFASVRWAQRLAAHRPYPALDALLAAADEAAYDLAPEDLGEALAAEVSPGLHRTAPHSAHLALSAAHAAYECRFGHVFVMCLDSFRPSEHPDQVLAGIRTRLGHDRDEERVVTADEMRRLARGRIIELVTGTLRADEPTGIRAEAWTEGRTEGRF
ncbi:2-oxo-4-hydroxy-4-carboxy-5-ureidoimidazoline decarboxylase [Streptomyces sp. NPDC058231]|uniref:2-oxo-4-hydroxy-4-carboxy-5-ureidoimidazoline decarboxylase n=1 Tax=Streptomyces sp. NPDC058231 TaxID=3346392 RepID=UPI0036E63D68